MNKYKKIFFPGQPAELLLIPRMYVRAVPSN